MSKEFSKLDNNELESVAGGKTYYLFVGRKDKFTTDKNSPCEILDDKGQTLYRFPSEDEAKNFFESTHKNDELKVIDLTEFLILKQDEFRKQLDLRHHREPIEENQSSNI